VLHLGDDLGYEMLPLHTEEEEEEEQGS